MRLFTGRGRTFLLAGAALTATGLALTQRDVLRLGVLLLVLPLLSAALLRFAPTSLRLRRRLEPEQVEPGSTATVRLHLLNPSGSWTRVLLASEEVPPAFGQPPRFAVDRLGPGHDLTVTYRLPADRRGGFAIGPLQYRVCDALGMAERGRTYPGTDRLIVLPRVHRLAGGAAGGAAQGQVDSGEAQLATSGDVDVSTREYRHGDDLRRVHWRATARHGELMVRREEQSQEQLATVLLDLRRDAHGLGADSSLEWAVSASASIAEHLAGLGFAVRLTTDGVDHGWVAADDHQGRRHHLVRLALAQPGPAHLLAEAVDQVGARAAGEVVIAVLGSTDAQSAAGLARIPPGLVLLLARGPDEQGAAAELRRVGWTCVSYRPQDDVGEIWGAAMTAWTLQGTS